MDWEQGATDELRRAIDRFEAAASRRRPLPAPEPVRRLRRHRVSWQRPTLATIAVVLLSSLAAVLLIFLERAEPPPVEVSERLEPDDKISTPAAGRPGAGDGQAASAGDAEGPLTAVRGAAAAVPKEKPPRGPEPPSGSRPADAGGTTAVSHPGEIAEHGDSRQTATERPGLRTEPLDGDHGDGDRAATPAAEEATQAVDDTTPPVLTVPSLMVPYRGVMTDAAGAPLVGLVSAIFALYAEPSGGVPLWVDIKAVRVDATGGYAVLLGGTTEFPMDLFATGETRWLGVQPDGQAERPRIRFTSEPETPTARDAAPLDGPPLSQLVLFGEDHGTGDGAATWAAEDATHPTLTVPPPPIPFRGVMTDASGAPLVGLVSTIFALYAEPSGGVPLWVDIKVVQAGAAGGYVVLLGGTTEFPVDLFATSETRWLGVQPDGEDEQLRVRFTRMPCALKARDADPVRGRPLSAFMWLGGEGGDGAAAPRHGQPARPGHQPSVCPQG